MKGLRLLSFMSVCFLLIERIPRKRSFCSIVDFKNDSRKKVGILEIRVGDRHQVTLLDKSEFEILEKKVMLLEKYNRKSGN
jgi:hypothetical protein